MKKGEAIRALFVLRLVTFIVLFIVSLLFLIDCAVNADRRLFSAVICMLGALALLVKEIWLRKRLGR